jgi:putative salt-induced outer membrane protein
MRRRWWSAALAATVGPTLALVGSPALADWTGKGEAGLVISSGNTDTETANAKLNLAREGGKWKNAFGLAGLYASDDDGRTAQRWEALTQSDYNFTPRNFWFGAARYEDDEFSGFEYQATVSTGLGHKFIDSDRTKFVGTAGVGYKFFETRDVIDEDTGALLVPGDSDSEVVFRGTIDFDHKFTATTSLLNKFIVESGADNTFVQNDLTLQVKMTDVLALALGYSVRHNTDPPPNFKKTDTLTTVNLVYEIK